MWVQQARRLGSSKEHNATRFTCAPIQAQQSQVESASFAGANAESEPACRVQTPVRMTGR
jgi:hypothetical protein